MALLWLNDDRAPLAEEVSKDKWRRNIVLANKNRRLIKKTEDIINLSHLFTCQKRDGFYPTLYWNVCRVDWVKFIEWGPFWATFDSLWVQKGKFLKHIPNMWSTFLAKVRFNYKFGIILYIFFIISYSKRFKDSKEE